MISTVTATSFFTIFLIASFLPAAIGLTESKSAEVFLSEMAILERTAKDKGLVRVYVTLERIPLDRLSQDRISVENQLSIKASNIYAELGKSAFPTGRWSNGIGQIGFYTDLNGLRILATSSSIVAFGVDTTDKSRSHAYNLDGSLEIIQKALDTATEVAVDIVLNTAEPAYSIERDGTTRFHGPSEVNSILDRIMTESYANGIKNIDRRANIDLKPIVKATINREAFYGLRDSVNIRALRLSGAKDHREAHWPEEALKVAQLIGEVEVIILLRGGAVYGTPSKMPSSAVAHQIKANTEALREIFKDAGIEKFPTLNDVEANMGEMPVRLKFSEIRRLYDIRDVRILSININKSDVLPALLNSTDLLNMPASWAAGLQGSGQTIVFLDSGVRNSHEFFKMAGVSKVTTEACFGTTGYNSIDGYNYTSPCPSQDSFNDSPVGLVNSGLPYSSAPFCVNRPDICNHGTAVAGVAAGKASANLVPAPLQGVAPAAQLTAVQLGSYRATVGAPVTLEVHFFPQDLMKAFSSDLFGPMTGTANPYVANLSQATVATYGADCNHLNVPLRNRIGFLKDRGVPVIISTGNKGIKNGIGYPACLSGAIKVASVGNDATGTLASKGSNIASQTYFSDTIFLAPGGNTEVTSPNTVKTSGAASDTHIHPQEGTSISAPHVAALYAIVKSHVPGISVEDATMFIKGKSTLVPFIFPSGLTENFYRVKISP